MCCGIGYRVDDSESVGGDGRINEFLSGAAKSESYPKSVRSNLT